MSELGDVVRIDGGDPIVPATVTYFVFGLTVKGRRPDHQLERVGAQCLDELILYVVPGEPPGLFRCTREFRHQPGDEHVAHNGADGSPIVAWKGWRRGE